MSLVYTSSIATIPGKKRNSVYIGGRVDAKDLDKLERWGISHILNVTPSKDSSIQAGVPNFFEKTKRFVYKRIAVYDASTSVTQLEEQIPDIVSFISNGLFHGSVLVHCQHGVSRSTTCVVLYLLSKAELSLQDAMTMIKRRRPDAQPIPAFYQMLERFEKEQQPKITSNNNKKRTVEEDTTASARKTHRVAVGPSIGPARGPSIGPTIGPMAPPTSTKKSIGPTLPRDSDESNTETKTKPAALIGPTIGPAIGPTVKPAPIGPSIGPSLPPSKDAITEAKVLGRGNSDTVIEPVNEESSPGATKPIGPSPKETPTIGPSLPPTPR